MIKKAVLPLLVTFGLVFNFTPVSVLADSAPALATPVGLSLAEIKMTGSEFIMLQNNTGSTITNLIDYSLYGFNKVNPLDKDVNVSVQQLPNGSLLNGQTLLLSDGGATCGSAITDSLSISLTDGGGYLEIVKSELMGGLIKHTSGDAVSWTTTANTDNMIASVPTNTTAKATAAWYRYLAGSAFKWQRADQDAANNCQLNVTETESGSGPSNPGSQLLPGLPPPATIISFVAGGFGGGSGGNGAANNAGLRALVLNEILPNPAEPQSDADDEYIEIYNPNDTSFDLYGYKLQTKSSNSSSKRTYTFPKGTKIDGKKFAAYPSSEISVSLANNGGQVWLLDPNEGIISQTEAYGEAEDGQAWALAEGKWYWTTKPTPNAANVIDGSGAIGGGTSTSGNGIGTVEGITTPGTPGLPGNNLSNSNGQTASLHPAVLAVVGALALLYGLYEYRNDIKNLVHKYQRNRAARQAGRPKPKGA